MPEMIDAAFRERLRELDRKLVELRSYL